MSSNSTQKTKAQHLTSSAVSDLIESAKSIVVGKDILELLSSSMYLDPLTVYREYMQNSADAIDEAVRAGLLGSIEDGKIEISLDHIGRRAIIRDNGIGIENTEMVPRLTSIGASQKRGSSARGFRGVGRLAGLGYCQELIFRSKSERDNHVRQVAWDCRKLKALLSDSNYDGVISEVVSQVVTISELEAETFPPHFFEVEMVSPRRLGNDSFLNEVAISDYISQVCPVPFNPSFKFAEEIKDVFISHERELDEYRVYINEGEQPIYRPHGNAIHYSDTKFGKCTELVPIKLETIDGETAGLGWVLHHDYQGAIPASQKVRGLRARMGNLQIGGERIFADLYPEERFNSWTVGEIHVFDSRAMPNGRRDDFEPNTHTSHIRTHLLPVVSDIARRCRSTSQVRNRVKTFELGEARVEEALNVMEQGAVSKGFQANLKKEIGSILGEMEGAAGFDLIQDSARKKLIARLKALSARADKFSSTSEVDSRLDKIGPRKRKVYQEVFDLIHECSQNRVVANSLIEKILDRISKL